MTVNSATSGSGDEQQQQQANSNPKQANGNGKSIAGGHDDPTNDRDDATWFFEQCLSSVDKLRHPHS